MTVGQYAYVLYAGTKYHIHIFPMTYNVADKHKSTCDFNHSCSFHCHFKSSEVMEFCDSIQTPPSPPTVRCIPTLTK